jgi:hypothetical protein
MFVEAFWFHERNDQVEQRGAKARPPQKTICAWFGRLAVPSQQQRGSSNEVNELLLIRNLMFQHEGSHHGGKRLFFEVHVVHLQIQIRDSVPTPST